MRDSVGCVTYNFLDFEQQSNGIIDAWIINGDTTENYKSYYFYTYANNIEKFNLKIYPTTSKINIKAEGILGVEVINIQGESVYRNLQSFENLSGLKKLDLSNQPKGIYFIKITTSKGVAVEKIVLH